MEPDFDFVVIRLRVLERLSPTIYNLLFSMLKNQEDITTFRIVECIADITSYMDDMLSTPGSWEELEIAVKNV